MNEPTPEPDENPYLATEVAEIATSAADRSIEGIWQVHKLPWKNILTNCLLFRYNPSHDNDTRQ